MVLDCKASEAGFDFLLVGRLAAYVVSNFLPPGCSKLDHTLDKSSISYGSHIFGVDLAVTIIR